MSFPSIPDIEEFRGLAGWLIDKSWLRQFDGENPPADGELHTAAIKLNDGNRLCHVAL